MRALIQRVSGAQVEIDQDVQARIGPGLLVFLGVTHDDTEADAAYLAGKVSRLRVFSDENGKMNRSVADFAGEVLVVSQFTLYGDVRKGNRPGFDQAAAPAQAELLYNRFVSQLRRLGLPVKTGRFAAHMRVSLLNDGPVTLMLESPPPK
ncbi:MAG: D-aminoacyl-tRNA deacylase [Saccharofermentanales bacterium]|jgi:D-tyrosyl-tRNA(Tyr) deacylase|nr:D-tyrosyl-tRNA(Tyr) deacylase [Clostridiaceae bacterium]